MALFSAGVFGLLVFFFPDFYPEWFGSWAGILALCLISFAGCASLSAWAVQRLMASLSTLADAVRDISRGSRELEIEVGGDPRVEELAEALSVMAMDRFRAEDALMISEERFRQLFECAPDAILVADSLGKILDANTAACQLYGRDPAALKGANVLSLVPVSARSHAARNFRNWFVDDPKHQEGVCYNAAGLEVPVEINGSQITYAGQRAVILTLRDVTLRKQVERTLEDARGKARRLTQLQTAFLANISHEIRTPMTAIIGMSDLLTSTDLNAEQQEYAETIGSSCEHLLGILTNVVDLAKLESGYVEIQPVPFNLQDVVSCLSANYQARAERKGLHFDVELAPGMPSCFSGDEARIQQVLSHLLDNAVKFTPAGKVRLEVSPAAAASSDEGQYVVHFSVSDTGIGMSRDLQKVVFNMFSQADDTTTRQYGGMGIGLALCRKVVEKMGGILSVTSRKGEGATFSFCLPLGRVGELVESVPYLVE